MDPIRFSVKSADGQRQWDVVITFDIDGYHWSVRFENDTIVGISASLDKAQKAARKIIAHQRLQYMDHKYPLD